VSAKKQDSMTREQLLAMRDIKAAGQADPIADARRHEASFLRNIAAAGEDHAWIIANQAWLQLGFDTFVDWYEARVAPVAARLGLRPAREQAKAALEQAAQEQRALPPKERRPQRELARVFGVSQPTVSRALGDSNESNETENAQVGGTNSEQVGENPRPTEDHTNEDGDRPDPDPSSAQPESPRVDSGGAPAELEESPDSPPVVEQPQGKAGVSSPAAAPQLVETPIGPMTRKFAEQLDRLVPDPNPHREWQTRFLDNVFAAAKAMRGYSGAEIAEKADDQLRAEFASFVGDMDSLLHETSAAFIAAAGSNVRPLRRIQ